MHTCLHTSRFVLQCVADSLSKRRANCVICVYRCVCIVVGKVSPLPARRCPSTYERHARSNMRTRTRRHMHRQIALLGMTATLTQLSSCLTNSHPRLHRRHTHTHTHTPQHPLHRRGSHSRRARPCASGSSSHSVRTTTALARVPRTTWMPRSATRSTCPRNQTSTVPQAPPRPRCRSSCEYGCVYVGSP